ncbi:MAG TPA: Zn-ribbon domain-containing OB-fold protein [Caulobacteraceae bacterium]|nr:Zn-ribbon domain-containing OB-fold protein [Caulobacteraceae bacterium]
MSDTQTMAATRRIPAPAINNESKPFWDAAQEGRFLIKRCGDCGKAHWYPRVICPYCFSLNTKWEESPGEGVIYTFSVMFHTNVPYAIGYVNLNEGPAVLTNFVGCDLSALAIGQKVKVRFQETEGGPPVPVFGPI